MQLTDNLIRFFEMLSHDEKEGALNALASGIEKAKIFSDEQPISRMFNQSCNGSNK